MKGTELEQPTHELNYMSTVPVVRAFAIARIHLLVWSCIFYALAGCMTMSASWCIWGLLIGGTGLGFSGILILIFATCLFLALPTYVLWVMGKRCVRWRRALLARDVEGFRWARPVIEAIFAICIFLLLAAIFVTAAIIASGDMTLEALIFPAAAVCVTAAVGWSKRSITHAEAVLVEAAEEARE